MVVCAWLCVHGCVYVIVCAWLCVHDCVYVIVCAELACWLISQRVRRLVNLQQGDPTCICPCNQSSVPTDLVPHGLCRSGGIPGTGAASAPASRS